MRGPGGRVHIAELLAHRNLQSLDAEADVGPGRRSSSISMHAFGAQFAEVRVDADTGEMRLSRLVGAFDTGRVLNAKTARSQLLGGIVYGIGMALFEETRSTRRPAASSTATSPTTSCR